MLGSHLLHHLPNSLSSKTGTSSPLNTNSPSPSPVPGPHHLIFCLHECDDSRDLIWVESCGICPFGTGLFHFALRAWGSSMWQCVSELPSFLRQNNSPLYRWIIFCLSIHLSMDTWIVSMFGLQIPVWELAFHSLGEISRIRVAGSRDHFISNFLGGPFCSPSYIPTNTAQSFQLFHSLTNTGYFLCFFPQ